MLRVGQHTSLDNNDDNNDDTDNNNTNLFTPKEYDLEVSPIIPHNKKLSRQWGKKVGINGKKYVNPDEKSIQSLPSALGQLRGAISWSIMKGPHLTANKLCVDLLWIFTLFIFHISRPSIFLKDTYQKRAKPGQKNKLTQINEYPYNFIVIVFVDIPLRPWMMNNKAKIRRKE